MIRWQDRAGGMRTSDHSFRCSAAPTIYQGELPMNKQRLAKEHELQLLKKLATDDDYRARFEKDPAGALKELGASDSDLAAIDPENLKPGKLSDKATIKKTYETLDRANVTDHVCMIMPLMRI